MSSSRRRSRKRNLTDQSVDLYNRVTSNDATPLPHPRRRNLNRKPFVPRSDDIFEVPSSPERQRRSQSRRVKSVPVTPPQPERRRIPSLRERLTHINYNESKGISYAAGSILYSDESESETKDNDGDSTNRSEGEEGGLHPVPVVVVQRSSNGNKDTERNTEEASGVAEDNAPPNTGGVEQTADNGANNGEPNDDGIDQGATGDMGYEPDPLQQAAHEDELDDSPAQQLASNMQHQTESVEHAPVANTSTQEFNLHSPISTRKRKLEAVSGTEETQPEPNPHQAADNDSSEESEEEESEESESDKGDEEAEDAEETEEPSKSKDKASPDLIEETAPDSNTRPQKRVSNKFRVSQRVSVERLSKRQKSPILAESDEEFAGSPSQDSISHSSSSSANEDKSQYATPPRESREQSAIADSVVEAGQDGAEPQSGESSSEMSWFEQAQNLGQQKENWDTFMKHSNTLQRKADSSRIERFNDPNNLIIELHQAYRNMREELTRGSTISLEEVAGCENLLRGISNEGFRMLDEVWSLSNKGREDRARSLLHGFETHVLPPMASLIISCFLAYYVGRGRFPRSYSQLHGAMTLLQSFCNRISNQIKTRIVQSKMLSRNLNIALKHLITALESGAMNLSPHVPSRIRRKSGPFSYEDDFADDGSSDIDSAIPGREWSSEESKILVEALRLYQGPDRYIQIIRHFGAQLPNRSTSELRSKAREIRDNFLPTAQGLLATPEGRQQVAWLLTV
ncbi:hypothetical protein PHISCL_02685 [Aspergillus sclerotialis]|uniref:Uncharacterized protein n=1 Tax=Aspergillus sclerotialis TaxID=2070753 RepID=A0A3A3A011_9EURO|nr:hypothetical protein PHISCL_02685 [Aspergillus sclerotialis]